MPPKAGAPPSAASSRIEASSLGLDIRFVVTSLKGGSPKRIYDALYCARGQAENLVKLHKSQPKSDRTSCRYQGDHINVLRGEGVPP